MKPVLLKVRTTFSWYYFWLIQSGLLFTISRLIKISTKDKLFTLNINKLLIF